MKKVVYSLLVVVISIIIVTLYFGLNIKKSPPALATEQKITGGTWSTTCTGNADDLHDGNLLSGGVTCTANYQEINFDFGGSYGSVNKIKTYSTDGDGNDGLPKCLYPYTAPGITCGLYGYGSWTYISATEGGINTGWNTFTLTTPPNASRLKGIAAPWGSFTITELEVYYTGSPPITSTPPPTPTPSGSSTPTPSGYTPTPSISGSGNPPPISCPNPPCYDNPDDPIETPTPYFNIRLDIPNGGEKWYIGRKYKIKWEYKDTENKIKKLALFFSKDGGKNYRQIIIQDLPLSTEYEWTIPNDESYVTDEAKIIVGAYSDSINRPLLSDGSNNNFSIVADQAIGGPDFSWTWISLALLALSGLASAWPAILNFALNSWITTLLNRLLLLTAPTMGNKKGTGIVYDSYTKLPIAKVLVQIFNAENNKKLESVITNKKGEFSFILTNGKYYLKVYSTIHNFPSQYFARVKTSQNTQFVPRIKDNGYENLYFGEIISVKKDPTKRYNLNINIPIDKTAAFNVNEKIVHFLKVIGNILTFLKWPSIVLGVILSIYSLWSDYSIFAVAILALYIILIIYEIYLLLVKSRPFGIVKDENNSHIGLAVIRFNNPITKVKSTSISGRDGKFTTQVNPGNYSLLTKKGSFIEDKRNISIKSTRKLEKLNITLAKNV